MLSKEEVALIESYREEAHVSLSSSLRAFGISSRQYYRAKHKYQEEQDGAPIGEFIQLSPERGNVSTPLKRRRTVKSTPTSAAGVPSMTIEFHTTDGSSLLIQGVVSLRHFGLLLEILHPSTHVQSE
jgi:hypothetical protein